MKQDVFDRIMAWRLFAPFRPLLKHKEVLLYLFFGGLTTFLNLACYAFGTKALHWGPLFTNIIAWVIAVLFAYITNHIWVFSSTAHSTKALTAELLSFVAGRLATLALEEGMLWVGIDLLGVNDIVVKLIAQIAVIIGNYIISKLLVFKSQDTGEDAN